MKNNARKTAFMESLAKLMEEYGVIIEGTDPDHWWFANHIDDKKWIVDGDDLERHCNP